MSHLDLDFKTLCQRTEQAERSISRQQELMSVLIEKGQPVDSVSHSLPAMQAMLKQLRTQRSEMARQLRYRARSGQARATRS